MSLQTTVGVKRKLSNDDDDVDLFQDEVANPAKRHTESQRVLKTDILFEDQGPDNESSDSQYEYTFIDDDENNEPYIPITNNTIKTKHNTLENNDDDDNDIDITQFENNNDDDDDDDDDLMMNTKVPKQTKTTALDLNWSDEDECIEQYESDNDKKEENSGIAWFPQQKETITDAKDMKYDKSAYNVLYKFNTEWPCLTFDVILDNLGAVRTTIPYSLYLVCGSQADPNYRNTSIHTKYSGRIQNKIQFLKLNQVQKTKYDDDKNDIAEEKDSEYINITDEEAILQNRDVFVDCVVNRIKTKRFNVGNEKHLVAVMGADCNLYIYDGTQHILSLDGLATNLEAVSDTAKPLCRSAHCDEGYGVAWNKQPGNSSLLTGSCAGELRLYQAKSATFVRTVQFKTLKASIEDVEWSPQHSDIFVSVGVDKCIRVWDARNHKKEHVARVQNAHREDINVCSWNPHSNHQHLLLTGSDDHSFKIWDLRKLQNGGNGCFNKKLKKCGHYYMSSWHIGGITSIEWHPNDSSSAIVSSEDNQISLWDFSLEEDNSIVNTGAKLQNNNVKIPPQLTFMHGGQQDIKEVHFHPQIPNLCISTAGSGFQLFQPDNLMESCRNEFKNMSIVD